MGDSANGMGNESSTKISNDVATWKNLSTKERDSIAIMGPQLPRKSLQKDSKSRSFLMSIFARKMPNGETVARDWLVWSLRAQSFLHKER